MSMQLYYPSTLHNQRPHSLQKQVLSRKASRIPTIKNKLSFRDDVKHDMISLDYPIHPPPRNTIQDKQVSDWLLDVGVTSEKGDLTPVLKDGPKQNLQNNKNNNNDAKHIQRCLNRDEECKSWSTVSWSSLYERGTDSSLSWADDECEKATTEKVKSLFDDIEDCLYSNQPDKKTAENQECQIWREHFPHLRIVGKRIDISSQQTSNQNRRNNIVEDRLEGKGGKRGRSKPNKKISSRERRENKARDSSNKEERKLHTIPRRIDDLVKGHERDEMLDGVDKVDEESGEEGEVIYAEHGYLTTPQPNAQPSVQFSDSPMKFLEEKILSELLVSLLGSISEDLKVSVSAGIQRANAINAIKESEGSDSLEDDSIFSLAKIAFSPKYGQYPDLSDEDDIYPPMSLPTFRQIPASAPVVPRISIFQPMQQPNSSRREGNKFVSSSQTPDHRKLSVGGWRLAESTIDTNYKSLDRKKSGRRQHRNNSGQSTNRGRRSRSESDSPPYLRQPVSLPPITSRPKTNGGERENKLFGQDRPKTMGGGTTGGGTHGTAGTITGTGKLADFQVTVSGLALRRPSADFRPNSNLGRHGPMHWGSGQVSGQHEEMLLKTGRGNSGSSPKLKPLRKEKTYDYPVLEDKVSALPFSSLSNDILAGSAGSPTGCGTGGLASLAGGSARTSTARKVNHSLASEAVSSNYNRSQSAPKLRKLRPIKI